MTGARHAAIAAATARARAVLGNAGRSGPWPRYLFSGLIECANCGSPFVTLSRDRYGCSAARYRGAAVCDVRTTVPRSRLKTRLLDTIRGGPLQPGEPGHLPQGVRGRAAPTQCRDTPRRGCHTTAHRGAFRRHRQYGERHRHRDPQPGPAGGAGAGRRTRRTRREPRRTCQRQSCRRRW